MKNELVLILDFGGQYKELISRMTRRLNVYSEIKSGKISAEEVKKFNPIGIILTGGPNSAYLETSPKCDPAIFELGIPILGICYGMQTMCFSLGGRVETPNVGEYGRIETNTVAHNSVLMQGVKSPARMLMSHTDQVTQLPQGFVRTASTAHCQNAACENVSRNLYAVQFHPEVELSDDGEKVMHNFLFNVCKAAGSYRLDDYIETRVKAIRQAVGTKRVLLGLSGGVDSSVCAALLSKAIGEQLTCIFVDHGLMRYKEGDAIEAIFSKKKLHFIRVNAADRFLKKLKGISSPEEKRKIIGAEFVRVFEDESSKLGDIEFLAQGTIYPDIIESGGEFGDTIKSHHNVGGLPDNHKFEGIVEPLSGLFKDEVRIIGKMLGLPDSLVYRQPFPGPGLAIRIMGDITQAKLDLLQRADHIVCEEIGKLRKKPQQYFAVLTDTRSVGVKGDHRTYDYVVAVRAVTTSDFMTCEYTPISHKVLSKISSRITGELANVSRIVYDITSKPPATVEWE
ncbi:MAG: glutamine-hydrolyzing GMP synthase [Bacteroidales bacterium]|jgi:GMP synthase (glutamine-hydrolysing)|nr:glutamine-hydrolyzing GMP synthase [Bacteroidales bacterium]